MKRAGIVAALCAFSLVVGRAQTPSTLPLVQPGTLIEQYAFRLPPIGATDVDGFSYGGSALAFNAARNSLFLVGFELAFKVAEVSIPPAAGVATILQPLADVTEGRINSINPTSSNTKRIGGLLPWNNSLVISAYDSYDGNETQKLSHFVSGQTLATTGDLQGPFQVGVAPLKAGYVSGYMGVVPPAWRAALGGPAFTGNAALAIIGRTSQGPAVSTFDPADVGVKTPVPATALVYYDQTHPLGAYNSVNPYYNGSTEIRGVVMPEGTRSVLFFGRHGSTFCYGAGTTNQALDRQPVPNEPGVMYCYDPEDGSKGTHGYPYRYQVWAYDANDLAAVKAGQKQPWEPKPYATWALTFPTSSSGTHITGATYDPATNRLLIGQGKADGDRPVIHVFKVNVATVPTPPTTTCTDPAATNVGGLLPCLYPPPPPTTCTDPTATNTGGSLPCTYPPPPPTTCTDPLATNNGGPLPCVYPAPTPTPVHVPTPTPVPVPPVPTATVTSRVAAKDCVLTITSTNPYGTGGTVQLWRNPGVKQGSAFSTPTNGIYLRSATVTAGLYNTFSTWTNTGQPSVTSPVVTVKCEQP